MPEPTLQAVLFDMDGTLVDTETLWWQAVEYVASTLAYEIGDADLPEVLGRPVEHTAAHLWRMTGGDGEGVRRDEVAAALEREFTDRVRDRVVPRPGALELLASLAAAGVPTALVTASPRSVVDAVLAALGEAVGFAVTVTADDTERTKPAPDPYLAAARALGVTPGACVAVEDTPTGVASAEAAGCRVLAVPSMAPIGPAAGRTVRDSLEGVDVPFLRSLAGGSRRLRVMSWNLWHGGRYVDDARAKQVKALLAADVDVVGLQETDAVAARELAEALGWEHHQAGTGLAVLSRHPVVARAEAPGLGFYGGLGVRVRLEEGREVSVWTAHLDHTPYGPYEACFDRLPVPELLDHEEASGRLGRMRGVLAAMGEDLAAAQDGAPVVLTGDLNVPSHLDWTPDTAPLHGGHGPVPWPVTRLAEEAGLLDSYRVAHPDPRRAPGFTWSPVHDEHEDGSGRPEPQDRIDYVLYAGARLRVLGSETYAAGDVRPWPRVKTNDWPSDHAAVITTFTLR
ncbi:HAD-IA family hydrolase [Streptomyces sp. MUM 203J]|uniref:HAD-IA family hydrolase n=1 Tax=Streptomyces sp. MUM 203J TaxID=2791990 RepID=UPI0027E3C729|nr:HAD-IA family hydrolase [Streptomyces sp. MUM 203J]MCH0539851.1 HAD-IA family hydrolase [Streptomyces sp. MUM 203J]